MVITIPEFSATPGLTLAGEDISYILKRYKNVKDDFHSFSGAVIHNYGVLYPSFVCDCGDFPDSFFRDFTSCYWDYLNSD